MHRRPPLVAALALTCAAAGGCLPSYQSVTPVEAIRLVDDKTSADARREGLADLSTRFPFARVPPYTTRYRDLAEHDPDYVVRAMAVRALNVSRDPSATQVFVAALEDEHELVRLEGAKALANLPDAAAVPGLIRRLQGSREMTVDGHPVVGPEDRDVRIAAADALRHYGTPDVERVLVVALGDSEFGIAWQARQSLVAITGQDLRYDEGAWLNFLVSPGRRAG